MPFARNHRGEAVHAGKRTEQNARDLRLVREMAGLVQPLGRDMIKGGKGANYEVIDTNHGYKDDQSFIDPATGKYNRAPMFTAHEPDRFHFRLHDPMGGEAYWNNLLDGDDINPAYESPAVETYYDPSWEGGKMHSMPGYGFSTHKRAKIAAQAMYKRAKEGRNLRTGRSQ